MHFIAVPLEDAPEILIFVSFLKRFAHEITSHDLVEAEMPSLFQAADLPTLSMPILMQRLLYSIVDRPRGPLTPAKRIRTGEEI